MSCPTSRTTRALVLLSAFLTTATAQTACAQAPLRDQLLVVTQRLAAADSFSGAVLVAKGDTVIFSHAAGIANRETHTPITLNTRLQTASVTKLYNPDRDPATPASGQAAAVGHTRHLPPALPECDRNGKGHRRTTAPASLGCRLVLEREIHGDGGVDPHRQ